MKVGGFCFPVAPPLYVPPVIHDIEIFDMAELTFFTYNINPAYVWETGMISP